MSVNIGFWTPSAFLKDPDEFAFAAMQYTASDYVADDPFPLSVRQVGEQGRGRASIAVVRGHIPMHLDNRAPNEISAQMFNFIVATRHRPCLMTVPPAPGAMGAMLNPANQKTVAFGCIELRAGVAVHFDTSKQFHGITGLPMGSHALPEAVIIQVPWPNPREIANAINAGVRILREHNVWGKYIL